MVETGRRRPGGDHQALRWITGAAEAVPLRGPYALVTAGASLHWMPWRATLTRLAAATTSHAYLAIVDHGHRDLRAIAGLVRPYATDGVLGLPVAADVTWGRITVTAGS